MPGLDEWHVYVRDANNDRQGEIDDFVSLDLYPTYSDVGTWTLKVSSKSTHAADLMTPGWGLEVVRDGFLIMAGPTETRTYTVDSGTMTVEVDGVSDEIWLKRRVVSPSPTETAPPYIVQAYDVRTGLGSTIIRDYVDVNAGPSALGGRAVPNLIMADDPFAGSTVTGNGRWDNLLAFIQTLAVASGTGFRVSQTDSEIQFETFAPVDRSADVVFSVDLGNLAKFSYTATAPTANYVYAGGDGDGTARTIVERLDANSIAAWGRVEGDFVASTGTTDSAVLTNAAIDAMNSGQETAALSIAPIETDTMRYGRDYFLGDKVTVQLDQPVWTPYGVAGRIVDQIRKIEIHVTTEGAATVTPLVSGSQRTDIFRLFKEFRWVRRRLNNLERY